MLGLMHRQHVCLWVNINNTSILKKSYPIASLLTVNDVGAADPLPVNPRSR